MSCVAPCATCSAQTFYSCLSCDTTISSQLTLVGTQCLLLPNVILQIITACLLVPFILFPLFRKRALVATKIFDIIQMISFFKYIVGYDYFHRNYLYVAMRSWTPWTQGWQLVTVAGDITLPIFVNEETAINKLIRIIVIWAVVLFLLVLIATLKSLFQEQSAPQFDMFMNKNIGNAVSVLFYVTVMDISFFCGMTIFAMNFTSVVRIGLFVVGLVMAIGMLVMLLWMFHEINAGTKGDQMHAYQYMFLLAMDYQLFNTEQLLPLPKREKVIHRYSNLRLIDIIKKIWFGLFLAYRMYNQSSGQAEEGFEVFGYMLIFTTIWYIGSPFAMPKELLPIIINIVGDCVLFSVLLMSILGNMLGIQYFHLALLLLLYVLAFGSMLLEMCLPCYQIIKKDLYETGLPSFMQAQLYMKMLRERQEIQKENEKKLLAWREQNSRLLAQKSQSRQRAVMPEHTEHQSEQSIAQQQSQLKQVKQLESEGDGQRTPKQPIYLHSLQDEATKYNIDLSKKRKLYKFDKASPFVYSNKVDL